MNCWYEFFKHIIPCIFSIHYFGFVCSWVFGVKDSKKYDHTKKWRKTNIEGVYCDLHINVYSTEPEIHLFHSNSDEMFSYSSVNSYNLKRYAKMNVPNITMQLYCSVFWIIQLYFLSAKNYNQYFHRCRPTHSCLFIISFLVSRYKEET